MPIEIGSAGNAGLSKLEQEPELDAFNSVFDGLQDLLLLAEMRGDVADKQLIMQAADSLVQTEVARRGGEMLTDYLVSVFVALELAEWEGETAGIEAFGAESAKA